MTILLTQDQAETLKTISQPLITQQGNRFYYCPYWFKDIGQGRFEKIPFEKLPEEVKDIILANRGIKL
jgi:hypothetical protein